MSWEIRLEPEATREIAATSLWYDQRQDGVGDTFTAEVWEQIRGLDRFPNAGTPVHGVGGTVVVRQVRLRRFPFLVVYVVSDERDPRGGRRPREAATRLLVGPSVGPAPIRLRFAASRKVGGSHGQSRANRNASDLPDLQSSRSEGVQGDHQQ